MALRLPAPPLTRLGCRSRERSRPALTLMEYSRAERCSSRVNRFLLLALLGLPLTGCFDVQLLNPATQERGPAPVSRPMHVDSPLFGNGGALPEPEPGWQLLVGTPVEARPLCPSGSGRDDSVDWSLGLKREPREARVVPVFRDGETVGFKVFAIRRDSRLLELGFCDKDVLIRVNGHSLESTETALAVYHSLADEPSYTVELLREQRMVILVFPRLQE